MSQTNVVTPIGPVFIEGNATHLTSVRIGPDQAPAGRPNTLLVEAARQIAAWFDGALEAFDLPLAPPSTPRGPAHRAAIAAIPYGRIAGYGEVARSIASSPRAVGQACARNPFPLIIPCHRIVGAGGSIGHYSAGEGIATKRWLLAFEARRAKWVA